MSQMSMYSIKQAIHNAKQLYPNCRPGQAYVNDQNPPKQLADKIYELKDKSQVAEAIYEYYQTNP